MLYYFFVIFLLFSLSCCDDCDLGYSLRIGNAIDVFANYGDLSMVTQVVSFDYNDEDIDYDDNDIEYEPFREKNIRIFVNATSKAQNEMLSLQNMNIYLCNTFQDLLDVYFKDFVIEGASKPWKAFMGNWVRDEIMRTFGLSMYDNGADSCCYVLVKLTKTHKSVKMDDLADNVEVKDYVRYAMKDLDPNDDTKLRRFMKSYGTHYIDSYVTGNFIYQVFKYKRIGYNLLKSYINGREKNEKHSDSLRFYFSSYFLKHVGEIRIASSNKTIETWAKTNLVDSQYLYSKPSLLKLHYSPVLVKKLNNLLDNGALLSMTLKSLKPIFKDAFLRERFCEIVQNDLQLWEVNA